MLTILSAGLIKVIWDTQYSGRALPVVREILCCHLRTTSE